MIKKILSIAFWVTMLLTLMSCHYFRVYRPDIQQGNVITSAQLKSIHRGMTRSQVINKLGAPILTNIYYANQLTYIYSYQPAYGSLARQYLIISFARNRVTRIDTNMTIPAYSTVSSTQKTSHATKKMTLPQPTK